MLTASLLTLGKQLGAKRPKQRQQSRGYTAWYHIQQSQLADPMDTLTEPIRSPATAAALARLKGRSKHYREAGTAATYRGKSHRISESELHKQTKLHLNAVGPILYTWRISLSAQQRVLLPARSDVFHPRKCCVSRFATILVV